IPAVYTYHCGARGNHSAFASCLYDALRHFDDTAATSLLAEGTGAAGLGLAIMNRLRKASGGDIVYV
ncbi:Sua5 family C-terminal domain-containing protein, partial [Selenomonas sp. F0473]|uniref:Sua5 family C-terminal domain-containing protein n=2 Tax=Selenomonas TaxID=970 RepID=UPI0025D04D70